MKDIPHVIVELILEDTTLMTTFIDSFRFNTVQVGTYFN